jgi:hypothetical protein
MVMKELETINISDETLKRMHKLGVVNWFDVGLRFSEKNTWKGEYWILDIINKEKFFLAKIRYGF